MENKKIMCVGLCCIDDIYEVNEFPKEDTDQRSLDCYRQRGGNASNNCSVLGILGANPSYFGTIAKSEDNEYQFILKDFELFGVDVSSVIFKNGFTCPKSCVILSKKNGSRTILHNNKDLPELTYKLFLQSQFKSYSWIHFEGRNVSEVFQMMTAVSTHNEESQNKIIISVEIEKAKEELEVLIPLADYAFISKEFAQMKKCASMDDIIKLISTVAKPSSVVICAWGEKGATALVGGQIVRSSIFAPEAVVDTLGAGDTFVASTLFALLNNQSVQTSVEFGCRIAGLKVGVKGWHSFKEVATKQNYFGSK